MSIFSLYMQFCFSVSHHIYRPNGSAITWLTRPKENKSIAFLAITKRLSFQFKISIVTDSIQIIDSFHRCDVDLCYFAVTVLCLYGVQTKNVYISIQ